MHVLNRRSPAGMSRFRPGRLPARSSGFTLVELLVVLVIIGLLVSLVSVGARTGLKAGRSAACQANLRQLAQAANAYAADHRGEYPWGYRVVDGVEYCWDFTTYADGTVEPGEMWDGCGVKKVMHCPECSGLNDNWSGNKFTGYNYNCSYLGRIEGDSGDTTRTRPARAGEVEDPSRTAMFGDGGSEDGVNKFMRAPRKDKEHDDSSERTRRWGTQAYRHRGRTNVAFCDGHVESVKTSYTSDGNPGFESAACGFLSPDNSLYSLEK